MRVFPVAATRLRQVQVRAGQPRQPPCQASPLRLFRLPAVSFLSRFVLQQGVLASPWWQRVLAVAPVILLLWLGVHWALGEG